MYQAEIIIFISSLFIHTYAVVVKFLPSHSYQDFLLDVLPREYKIFIRGSIMHSWYYQLYSYNADAKFTQRTPCWLVISRIILSSISKWPTFRTHTQ